MRIKLLVPLLTFFATHALQSKVADFKNFHNFQKACAALPKFDSQKHNPCSTFLSKQDFTAELDLFFQTTKNQFNTMAWINGGTPNNNTQDFQAFVEKKIIPNNSIVALHGDLHGDIQALNAFIETFVAQGFLDATDPFKIKHENFYVVFLGDYVDRGWYGAEVLYAILRLKNENPDHVFMVRGNHEDIDLNGRYGFAKEMRDKFSSRSLLAKVEKFYNCLPLALYLGSGTENNYNFVQCCHGGIEVGFDPHTLLAANDIHAGMVITHLMQEDMFKKIIFPETTFFKKYFVNSKNITPNNGFMWNDFIVNPDQSLALSPRDGFYGTMFEFGQSITKQLLKLWSGTTYTIRSIFRAHQHGDLAMRNRILNLDAASHPHDKGIGKLWIHNSIHQNYAELLDDVAVVTFSVAPNTGYGWPIHAFGQLTVADKYSDWRLKVLSYSHE